MANNPPTPGHGLYDSQGTSGLYRFSGYLFEEFLRELQGPRGRRTLREMRDNDSIIGAIMFAIEMLIRQTDWSIEEGEGDTGQAEFVDECLNDMLQTWPDKLGEVLTFLTYGWAYLEQIYKKRDGTGSKHTDGKIGWFDWSLRGQESLLRWDFADDGTILAMVQLGPPDYQMHVIPAEKSLLFRTSVAKNNPEGRALDPDTDIPTPHGWKKLDALSVGDSVFDEAGKIRYITARAEWNDRPCYRVTFNDGSSIVADTAHRWVTQTPHERSRRLDGAIRTTDEIASTVKTPAGVSVHSITWNGALDYPEQHLPLDPYVLGLWLGDGYSRAAQIACHADDAQETAALIGAAGYATQVIENGKAGGNGRAIRLYGDGKWDSSGPQSQLRAMGLIENKHIPQAYLRGNESQRRALLAGLMDSDGCVDLWGRCEFVNTNRTLVDGVAELVRSLGVGVTVRLRKRGGIDDKHVLDAHAVRFTPPWSPFRLVRKTARIINDHARRQHYIVACEPVEPRRTVCIEVDSPSHLFLAGTAMVPTHNSILRNAYTSWYFLKNIQIYEAIGVERDLAGMPYLRIPSSVMTSTNPTDQQAYTNYQNMVQRIKRDEMDGVILPSDVDPTTKTPLYEFSLLSAAGARQFDTDKIIQRHQKNIAMTVMADFIMLGHEGVGSRALSQSKSELFTSAIGTYCQIICAQVNEVAIPRLLRLNNMATDNPPKLVHGDIQRVDLESLGQYILRLSQAGFQLDTRFDSELTHRLMEKARLPDPPDDIPPWLNEPNTTLEQETKDIPEDDVTNVNNPKLQGKKTAQAGQLPAGQNAPATPKFSEVEGPKRVRRNVELEPAQEQLRQQLADKFEEVWAKR